MNRYFEQMILSASPIELIRLLYQRAIVTVRDARRHLGEKRVLERGSAINAAYLVLVELATSLNYEEAPELATRLGSLYVYMQKRLLEANFKQQDAPLAEVLGLLSTLAEGWNGVADIQAEPDADTITAGAIRDSNAWAQNLAGDPVRIAVSA